MIRKNIPYFMLIFFIFPLFLYPSSKNRLPEKHSNWLEEEVVYIISPNEKKVFLNLESDRERDLFIKEFWKQRDPTPGTPKNEFKEEHYRRIEFANKTFGRETPVDGWRTDRGRMYIKLGKPDQVIKFDSMEVYPTEIWYYQGNPRLGQVPIFRITFFKQYGAGGYQIYNPLSDGPSKLVPTATMMRKPEKHFLAELQDKEAHKYLKENFSLELAEASVSNFPGRTGFHFRLPSESLIKEVQTYPYKKVDDGYAYEFIEHKAIVEVNYSVHHIGNQSQINVIQDPSGIFFVNYVIVPNNLSLDQYQDKYFTNIKATARITDEKERTIFQWERNVPIELQKEELKAVKNQSFHFFDSFPLIQGEYILNLLWENTVTKEFTTLEKHLSIPTAERLHMSPLILSRKVNKNSVYSREKRAFQVGNLQMYPSPENKFLQKDTLFVFFQVYGFDQLSKENHWLIFSFYQLKDPYHPTIYKEEEPFFSKIKELNQYENKRNILEGFSLDKFPAGTYALIFTLLDNNKIEILSEQTLFSVSQKSLPGIWVVSQTNPPSENPVYSFLLGTQLLNKGNIQSAQQELANAHQKNPDSLDYALGYAKVLMTLKQYEQIIEILTPFVNSEKGNFNLYFYLGKSFQKTKKYQEAITYYELALSHKGPIAEVLNVLGECYFALGNKEQALKAWEKSLEINPNQEKVKKYIEDIKKE